MDIFTVLIIVAAIIIIFQLAAMNAKLNGIHQSVDRIQDVVEMSDQQRYEYSLKIDDREGWSSYLEGKYYAEKAKKEKVESGKKV